MGVIINIYKGNKTPMHGTCGRGEEATNYKKAYAILVVVMSKAIDEIGKSKVISQETENAAQMLKEGLEQTEEMYIGTN